MAMFKLPDGGAGPGLVLRPLLLNQGHSHGVNQSIDASGCSSVDPRIAPRSKGPSGMESLKTLVNLTTHSLSPIYE